MATVWRDRLHIPGPVRFALIAAEIVGPIAIGVLSILASTRTAVGTDLPANVGEEPSNVLSWALWVAIATVFSVGILRSVEHFANHKKRPVECVLTEFGELIWAKPHRALMGPIEQHRVTLFQVKRRRWWHRKHSDPRWTHLLVPRLRVPRSSREPHRVFGVNEHVIENCEAVAGLAFSNGHRFVVKKGLPDLHAAGNTPDDVYERYATLTNDDVNIVKQEQYYARVIGGVTLYVNGLRWGVLVADSSDPDALMDNAFGEEVAERALKVLTRILSKD